MKKMPIPFDVIKIANAYHINGKDLFVVGGSVRDFVQGKIPHDYDLVTNATPLESKIILKDFNVSDEQGVNFGVIRVYTKECIEGYEIAVYRKDISKGRDVKGDDIKVEYGGNIGMIEDCKRRDLTCNSLYYDINKNEIIDLVGGIDDIKNNIIRTVGNPLERFDEDRLRILRTLRFTARCGGVMDKITSNAIRNDNRLRNISNIDDVSQERIIDEFYKVFDNAVNDITIMQRYIDLLFEYDMWVQIFPALNIKKIEVVVLSKPIIFLNLIDHNIKDISKLLNKYKLPTDLINQMVFLQEYDENDNLVYKLSKLKNRFHIQEELILKWTKNIKWTNSFIKYCNDGFTIDGNDLLKKGFVNEEIEKEKERLELEIFKNNY